MAKRTATLILAVLLIPYLSSYDFVEEHTEFDNLESLSERIEISPNPNSILDWGEPATTEGIEEIRDETAESTIGMFTHSGLIPNEFLNGNLADSRIDLAIVIVDGKTGLWDARLEIIESTNVEIRSTIPPSGYLVQGTFDQLKLLDDVDSIKSVHEVPAGLFVHPVLRDAPADETLIVEIVGWKNADLIRQYQTELFEDSLEDAASEWLVDYWSPDIGRMWGEISTENLGEIITHPSIAYISPVPILELMNNNARNHMGINSVENTFITGLNGSGQKIAIGDSGLDNDHGDFNGRVAGLTSVTPGDSSTADPSNGHGTHVACTVLGSGMRSAGTYQGIAPEASLYFQAMEDDDTGALYSYGINSMLNSAYNAFSRIHTNSWGAQSGHGSYSTQSEDADDRVSIWDEYWQYEGMTVLFAAGNERNQGISPPGTAKNVITIGAHVNRYGGAPDDMYWWSSIGPTDDGRIKPDLVAPGDYVRSCRAQEASDAEGTWNNTWYLEYSGTSMSTPAAAGSAALVREYLMEIAGRPAPQAALIKALLILGAIDMGTRDIPNNNEGWGRLNLVNSLVPDGDVGIFVDDRSRLSSGQQSEYTFDITRVGEPLKIVLAWSDYPGSSSSNSQLRNDLDLTVINPNGQVYYGNNFNNGRSVVGGSKDSVNNVEVALIDNAMTGVWIVRVKDSSHGGSRFYQPYSIAVRGVNVNDLSPDPTFIADTFDVSVPIPQIGEEVGFSIDIINQGAGSIAELKVLASVNSVTLDIKTLSMSAGEIATLEWLWTPDAEGDNTILIHIDPNDDIEELSESNNAHQELIIVSVPGVRVTSDMATMTLMDSSDSSTTWNLILTNTALFETNATIAVSEPIRMQDGIEFDWFSSFTSNTFNLEPAESTIVDLIVIHPAPPEPGLYRMVVKGTDTENEIESELEIFFDVPLLSQADILLPPGQIIVNPLNASTLQIQVTNNGNGAQTYDVEMISPSGWHLGLDFLGAFVGSSHGSTGTLASGETRTIDITVNPPGAMIPAGSVFQAAIQVSSRVSSELWVLDIPLTVANIDKVSITPISGGIEHQVEPNDYLNISILLNNQGNREMELTPYLISIPGGWTVDGGLNQFVVTSGEIFDWQFSIEGNGLASSGELKIRLATPDGFTIDWSRTIDVRSGAIPRLEFYQVALPDGTNSDSPLGAGAHPVGPPGFDLGWIIHNDGSMTWRPTISMNLPDESWDYSCTGPTMISAGGSGNVWCTVIIPLSVEGGSEPSIDLVMVGSGIEITETISLLVDSVNKVDWTITEQFRFPEGYQNTFSVELQNTGNSDISEILDVSGPDGWDVIILDGLVVDLRPGESRSVKLGFTPNSGDDGDVEIWLKGASDIEGNSFVVMVDVLPAADSGSSISAGLTALIAILLFAIIGGLGALFYVQKGGDLKSIIPNETIEQISNKLGFNEGSEESNGIPCWICSQDVIIGETWACGECGARYHMSGQVSGCDIIAKGHCLHCDSEIDQLLEA
jgi:uncharacterized membrane protein